MSIAQSIAKTLGITITGGSSNTARALRRLRALGSSAHVWAPGANNAAVATLPSNNYLLSDFATLAAVDEVVGGVKDGMNPSGGISLTQATTANKPIVRRGSLNLLTYSEQFDNAAWIKSVVVVTPNAVTDPLGGTTADLLIGVGGYCYQELTVTANTDYTASIYLYAAAPITGRRLEFMTTGFATIGAANLVNVTTGWNRFTFTRNTGANTTVRLLIGGSGTLTPLYAWGAQVEKGVAIAGDYTPTTATAASNPSAGKYWWSFNGSNNSLLSGNLGITNACTIVIAGVVNKLSVAFLFTETTNGINLYYDASGALIFAKDGVGQLTNKPAAIAAGVPFVITARLSGGTAVLRVNGVQVASAATALTFSATTGARIGTYFDGTSNPANCALGWVVPIAVGLSDADCLTVERLVGSQFPGMAVF